MVDSLSYFLFQPVHHEGYIREERNVCLLAPALHLIMVRAFVHGVMGRRNDPLWWTH